ncbi:hypothetical protein KUTeg_024947 [Tegillarca granosa]|uniref:Uncharacterized protein n=1 Tax=Tegillarca granosa TaxID=220873 RepID=A0ABQ9DYV0_TEGGR|nr:hypothetical protein KUTeg_024947 [Tegillarca granosa]
MTDNLCALLINTHATSRQQLLNVLLNGSSYEPRFPPDYEYNNATKVTIQIYILSIDSLNEASMDFSVDIFLRQQWVDPRLQFHNKSTIPWLELDQKLIDKVWIPDTYFSNEKKATFHQVTVPNRLLHLYKNGTVFYSIRISMTLSCYMKLEKYPLDSQECPLILESYGYTEENVKFEWHPRKAVDVPELGLPQFTITKPPSSSKCDPGTFACLQSNIHLQRNKGYYVVQIFIPSILIVSLSWVSFWLDIDAVPARISLGVLTVLTMTTQSSGARNSLPRVSYIKAIDVWMATCLLFVFGSLLEFAYINVLTRRKRPLKNMQTEQIVLNEGNETVPGNTPVVQIKTFRERARRVDKLSRIIFPSAFIIFNLGFWIYYLAIHPD